MKTEYAVQQVRLGRLHYVRCLTEAEAKSLAPLMSLDPDAESTDVVSRQVTDWERLS